MLVSPSDKQVIEDVAQEMLAHDGFPEFEFPDEDQGVAYIAQVGVYEVDEEGIVTLFPEKMDVPHPEVLLERIPDTDFEGSLPEKTSLLGVYQRMRSPGKIILYTHNLKRFFWSLVKHYWYPEMQQGKLKIRQSDLAAGAYLVALSTYYHERFHHFCDIQRVMHNSAGWDRFLEEALAVAFEVRTITKDRRSYTGPIGSRKLSWPLFDILMREANRHTSPGYSQWRNYDSENTFWDGIYNYVPPDNHAFLLQSGVNVNAIIQSTMNGSGKGYTLHKM